MNVRKFIAASAREALRDVKESLGPDAIILSNRSVPGGVEIMAVAAGDMVIAETEGPDRSEKVSPGLPVGEAVPRGRTPAVESRFSSFLDDDNDYRVSLSGKRPFAQPAMTPVRAPDDGKSKEKALKLSEFLSMDGENSLEEKISRILAKDKGGDASRAESVFRPQQQPTRETPKRSYRHDLPVSEVIETRAAYLEDSPAQSSADVIPLGVVEEIRSLRRIIEQNLAGFAWGETARSAPVKTEVLRNLLDAGFSPGFTRSLLEELPGDMELKSAMAWVKGIADRNLLTLGAEEDVVDRGGFYALVGPTGVGKTTTAAKLAARCVLKHGANKVALVTTDSYRIGALEQLRIYGRILGVPVYMAKDAAELKQILIELKYKHMVVVDTMGLGQRDKLVPAINDMLDESNVRRLLVLSATSRGDTLDDILRVYKGPKLAGSVLTKVDEAASLAAPMDAIIRHEIKLHYVSNGQRVPEDLHLPNRAYLLHRAFKDTPSPETYRYDGFEPALVMMANDNLQVAAGGRRV